MGGKKANQYVWDVEEFRKKILAGTDGSSTLDRLTPSLDSIVRRYTYARFHYYSVVELCAEYKEHFAGIDDKIARTLKLMVRNQNKFSFDVSIGSHVFGCMQSLHSVIDMLSVVINCSLKMVACDEYISEATVKNNLKVLVGEDGKYALLKSAFDNMIGTVQHGYLNRVTNLAKHQRLNEPEFNDAHVLVFPALMVGGVSYPERPVEKYLADTFNGSEKNFIKVGNELHNVLSCH